LVPVDGQLGSIRAQIFTTSSESLPGIAYIQAQLYLGAPGSSLLVPQPALSCVLLPWITFDPIGTSATCQTTGAAVPVTAGSTAMIVISATSTSIPAVIPMSVTVSVGP
jgi:hypothetical protein